MIRFINPNYHAILIHYPIALLTVGLLIEIMTIARSTSSLRAAGRWMILLGALLSIPAATSGIFAKYDVVMQSAGGQEDTWANLKAAAKLTPLQWQMLNNHALWTSIGTGVIVLTVMAWLALCEGRRKKVYPAALLLMFWGMTMTGVGAYHAGEMVYRTQVATHSQDEARSLQADWNKQLAAAKTRREKIVDRLEYYVGPLQIHVIFAGLAFAIACGALGVSMGKRPAPAKEPEVPDEKPKTPAVIPISRIWLAAALAGFATVAVGWYVIACDLQLSLWDLKGVFLSQIWQPYRSDPADNKRMLMHLLLGGGIVVLPLLLAIVARVSRNRMLVGILGTLMILVVAAQIWVGILMLYDTDTGPLTRFNPPTPSDSGAQQASAVTGQ